MGHDPARPLLLRPRADRRRPVARRASLHRGGLARRRRARPGHGHRRRPTLVPARRRRRRPARGRAARPALGRRAGAGMIETRTAFPCFGGTCAISVLADGEAREAVAVQRARLLAWHDRFTCFDSGSELMRLNADAREVVPAGGDLRRFAAAVVWAHAFTGGLVDATLPEGWAGSDPRATL